MPIQDFLLEILCHMSISLCFWFWREIVVKVHKFSRKDLLYVVFDCSAHERPQKRDWWLELESLLCEWSLVFLIFWQQKTHLFSPSFGISREHSERWTFSRTFWKMKKKIFSLTVNFDSDCGVNGRLNKPRLLLWSKRSNYWAEGDAFLWKFPRVEECVHYNVPPPKHRPFQLKIRILRKNRLHQIHFWNNECQFIFSTLSQILKPAANTVLWRQNLSRNGLKILNQRSQFSKHM